MLPSRNALFFWFSIAHVTLVAQVAVPYTTQADRFGVFHQGLFIELESRKPTATYPNGERLAYISQEGELRAFVDGHALVLQRGETVNVSTSRGMLGWKQGDRLFVATSEGPREVCHQSGTFTVQDSLIAFHNLLDRTLNVYWRGRSFPIADVLLATDVPQWNAGTNTLVFFDHNQRKVFLFYRGTTEELCRDTDYGRVAPGGDVVAYVDDSDDSFKVFERGERIDLEPFPPASFKAGQGIVAYVSATGALRCYEDHSVYSLSEYAPSAYYVQDSVITWVDNGQLRTIDNGKLSTIERYVPENWQVSGGMIAYQDLNRELRIYHKGQRIIVTKEAGVKQFQLIGDAVVWRSNSGATKVWWNGRIYEHY